MTLTPPELALAPDAAARLDDYLRQVRAALAGVPDVNPDEVEADVREHVGNELGAAPRPVSRAALDAVLAKLGPPAQWGAGAGPTLLARVGHLLREGLRDTRVSLADRLRRAWATLWTGPEDWRLAYLSFGVFAVGVVTMVAFPAALVVSYVLSRAGLAAAREKGVELGAARKWLLYPPVVLVSLVLLLAAAVWPLGLGGVAFEQVEQARTRVARFYAPAPIPPRDVLREDSPGWLQNAPSRLDDDRRLLLLVPVAPDWAPVTAGLFVGVGAFAAWWAVLGVAGASFPHATRAVFCPLLDRFERGHGVTVAWVAFVLLVVWGGVAYRALGGSE